VLCEADYLRGALQLALGQQRAGADDPWRAGVGVLDDDDKVGAVLPRDPVVALLPLLLGNVAHRRQHPQAVEEAGVEVVPAQRPQLVAFGQRGLHLGGQVLGGEELLFGHCSTTA
jgi:hypothetical protein